MHDVNVDMEGHYGIDVLLWLDAAYRRLRLRRKIASASRRVRYLLGTRNTCLANLAKPVSSHALYDSL